MRSWWPARWVVGAIAVAVGAGACSPAAGGERTVVASFYPLAFAAERIAGPGWDVIDLTPAGAEAHDIELSIEDRAAIEGAEVVLYLGDLGFQPQVEDAVDDAGGRVVPVAEEVIVSADGDEPADPHVWLDPGAMRTMAAIIAREFSEVDPGGGYRDRAEPLRAKLEALSERYRRTLAIGSCRYRIAVVPHFAFTYVLGRYGFGQVGISGNAPEAEPTAERLARIAEVIESEEAGAIFYEPTGESRDVAQTIAEDHGVPALPLSTLESRPPEGNYITVMERNLISFRDGLGCP